MAYDYQAAVLGGGPGGYEAAIRCAQYGLKTALIEARELGGTCLNRGCIPTKALLHGAQAREEILDGAKIGIAAGAPEVDFAKLAAWKDGQVAKLRRGIEALEKANGVTVIRGRGVLTGVHALNVDGQTVTADKIILATGSAPARPPIPGIEMALTSDEVLALTAMPKSLAIIGGGVIGIEFATLFSSLGAKVTVLEMLPDILPGADADITSLVKKILARKGVSIVNGAKVVSIRKGGVDYELNGQTQAVNAETVIVCIGRKPQTKDIGLEEAGVALERGFVKVDDQMRSSVPNIYAIGDITGKIQLAHVASAQGMVAAARCADKPARMHYDIVPACVYTSPEIAYVGLTEQKAREQGRAVKIGAFPVAGNGRCLVMNQSEGLVKLVTDERTGEILGCQIIAPRATDLIAEVAAVMRCEGTVEELSDTIHPHPTVSEIVMEAAHDVEGLSCSAMPRRK